jgi:uncharacterized protein with GYD domain
MPKFMFKAVYSQAAVQGTLKEGFAAREAYIRQLLEGVGGKIEAFYWAYGDDDAILIVDEPNAAAAIATSLAVNAAGAIRLSTTPLLTAAEMDEARAKVPGYRAPGA